MNFRVGQKVVSTGGDYGWLDDETDETGGPVTGEVCTVISISRPGVICIAEYEGEFYAKCFRPAVEPDISVFTAMLKKTPRENERAAKRLRERETA